MNNVFHTNTQVEKSLGLRAVVRQKQRFMAGTWRVSTGMNCISKVPQAPSLVYSSSAPPNTSSLSLIILHLQDNKIFWPEIISLPSQAQIPRNRLLGSQFVGQVKGTVFQHSASRTLGDWASEWDPTGPRLCSEIKDTDRAVAYLRK